MSTEKEETGTEISDDPSGMWTEEEEQLLAEALKMYDDELMDEFLTVSDDEKPIPLTSEGRDKMKALLEQWVGPEDAAQILNREQEKYQEDLDQWKRKRRQRIRHYWRLWGSVAAAAIFTVIISVGNVQDSLAFKLPAAGFEAAVKDDYTQLFVETDEEQESGDEALDKIETKYSLGITLDGYSLESQIVLSDFIASIYENGELFYSLVQQVETYQIFGNTEQYEGEPIETMYGTAYFFQYEETNSLIWNYQGYSFQLEGSVSKEELLVLLESLYREDR